MVLDIIVGAFTTFIGVNNVFHFINDGLDKELMDAISWLFFGLCIIILGVILILFECKVKRQEILKEMGMLGHYLGKGTYVFFISILSYSRNGSCGGDWLWGGDNVSYGTGLGLLSAILCWILWGCMGHKDREH